MANISFNFHCSTGDGTIIECAKYDKDSIQIVLTNDLGDFNYIYLDKSTAIKFAKTLRTEINKIKAD